MKSPITYNPNSMTLHIKVGKYDKYLQCPFATWWKARKYFKRPRFRFRFGRVKNKGYWPMASTNYLKWYTSKWFPIHIMSSDIGWKDKWHEPRFEMPGHFIIFFGRNYDTCWQFCMTVHAPEVYCANDCTHKDHEDNYWESMLWYLHYADEYNNDIDVERPQGTRTYEDLTTDLVKARNTMQGHWSTSKSIDIDDAEIIQTFTKYIDMGDDDLKEFLAVDIKSEQLSKININFYGDYTLTENNEIVISVEYAKDNMDANHVVETSRYVRFIKDDNDGYIRVFFNNYNNKLSEAIDNNNIGIKIKRNIKIDLGPSFKDEFLNKRGIELIKSFNKV